MKSACRTRSKKSLADVSASLKAISDENRLTILCMLSKGELCVCEIWPRLGVSQNLASHHLKILKSAGLIRSRKEGLRVYYALDVVKMEPIQSLLKNIFLSYDVA